MKKFFLLSAYLFVGLISAWSPQTCGANTADVVDTEIRHALEKFSELSSRGDLQLFLAQFDEDANIMMVGSESTEVFKGRAALEVWLGQVFSEVRVSFQINSVDISHNGETAWAFVEGTETARDLSGKLLSVKPYRFSAVLVKKGDLWVWRLFHGSTPEKE